MSFIGILHLLLLIINKCQAAKPDSASVCTIHSTTAGSYDITPFCAAPLTVILSQPKDAKISIDFKEKSIDCGEDGFTHACIYVPGLNPRSIGSVLSIRATRENVPSAGVSVRIVGGSKCEAMPHKNRTALVDIQCPETYAVHRAEDVEYKEIKAREGVSPHLCEYYITLVSNVGCALHSKHKVSVTAVTGCRDTHPVSYTQDCTPLGGAQLTLHGIGFTNLQSHVTEISIGQSASCDDIRIVNDWTINCVIRVESPLSIQRTHSHRIALETAREDDVDIEIHGHVSVSFTVVPNFKHLFTNLRAYGVGGMQRQGMEIHDKVFLTRTLPAHIVRELGLTHVKGLILYGAPGTGKSLLARTIGTVLDTKHIQMVSSPELLNKYVGESERNLRALFAQAESDSLELIHNSPFHIIILDEIDAICKPRGRDMNNMGSLVYDSLVNQLLTKLDGLKQMDNLLVIGLTNRFELMDPALLRPGRFEVTIEMTLPDTDERKDIIATHLAIAIQSGRLAEDVNITRLAQLTSGYTPAQLAGMVRQAQAAALSKSQAAGSLSNVSIAAADFDISGRGSGSRYRVSTEACSAYSNVHSVVNGTLPATALVEVEMYTIITPCLRFLLEQQGFHVQVFEPSDILKDPHILQNIHNIGNSVRSSKVAVILVDLCYMLHTCGNSPSSDRLHSFLMSLRSFSLLDNGRSSLLIGICLSHCGVDQLKPHFNYLFGMVSKGPLSTRTLDTQKISNSTVKL